MRTSERLRGLKNWVTENLCKGRVMKAPGQNMNIGEIVTQEPKCYIAYAPARLDKTGRLQEDIISVVPGILIMPSESYAKNMEEQRFDRYNKVYRPDELGQHLSVQILFSVYEPGVRLPGFKDSVGEKGQGLDLALIEEGTEQGLSTLFNWMDDCMQGLLGLKAIPDTDLFVEESKMTYEMYTDQQYVVDRRPIYYGVVKARFGCYASEGANESINKYLL